MSDSVSVLDRFIRPATKPADPSGIGPADSEAEQLDDHGSFGWLRGVRDRAIMLELRKKDGSVRAIGYAWLHEVLLDPSKGITLCLPNGKITLVGRNINAETRPNVRLFQGILRHKVTFVLEADQARSMQAKESDTIIERIEW